MASSSNMTTTPQVYLYTRVSNPQSESVDSAHQIASLTRFAVEQNWRVVKNYHDKGSGASTATLPGMVEMLGDIASNSCPNKMILVFEVSRFSRTWENAIKIFTRLRELKTSVFSVSQYLYWNATSYSANSGFEAVLTTAQQEWYLARDRSIASVSARKAAGHKFGQAPYGFKRSQDKKSWVENPEEQAQIKQIIALYNGGMSCYDIADEMKRQGKGPRNMWWVESSVRTALQRAGVFKPRLHKKASTGKIQKQTKVFSSYRPVSGGRQTVNSHGLSGVRLTNRRPSSGISMREIKLLLEDN